MVNSSIARATLLSAGLATGCIVVPSVASAQDYAAKMNAQPPAHLMVEAALPGPLAMGLAIIPFSAENIKIAAKYGEAALAVTPRIGHLHISVDDASWHWVHSNDEPVVIQGLATGSHRILLELRDANHGPIEAKAITFDIQGPPHAH
jgi:hypothetical protein